MQKASTLNVHVIIHCQAVFRFQRNENYVYTEQTVSIKAASLVLVHTLNEDYIIYINLFTNSLTYA